MQKQLHDPEENVFLARQKELATAHGQGDKEFSAATQRVMEFVLGYPAEVLGTERAATAGDSLTEVTYEAALRGLSKVIGGEGLRRKFVATFSEHVASIDDSEKPGLVKEALHNSFPDEVDAQQEEAEMDPRVFGAKIRGLIKRAESLGKTIKATNDQQKELWIARSYWRKNPRLVLRQRKGEHWRDVVVIGSDARGLYFIERTTQRAESGANTISTVDVHEEGEGAGRTLEGCIETDQHSRPLRGRGMLFQVNDILGIVDNELGRRERNALQNGRSTGRTRADTGGAAEGR